LDEKAAFGMSKSFFVVSGLAADPVSLVHGGFQALFFS
jgi:hypothetical protein